MHSFTPKLLSRLANLDGVANPVQKGSVREVEPVVERDGKEEKRGVGFPFHSGGGPPSYAQPPQAESAPFTAAHPSSPICSFRRCTSSWSHPLLLSLPLLAGHACVKIEFVRCAGYLVSGAPPEEVEPQRAPAWEDFRADTIPDVFFPAAQLVASGLVAMQAIYTPTPSVRMVGLLDALGMPWAALKAEGLPHDVLFALDSHVLTRSLTFFHRAVLEQAPDNPTAAFLNPSIGGSCSPLFLFRAIAEASAGTGTGTTEVHIVNDFPHEKMLGRTIPLM
ncbi:Rho GTPase activating protein 22 [Mycena venus]|uniref:Rho GTPase activating protein 22 n=1 Tax=Mycena venus TaxID=2733690 RepID=A0A8H6Z9A7_9AGAR|nr:Rho GTPase activating protein 22 [Mycena venus]